jgi:hypothetical protein
LAKALLEQAHQMFAWWHRVREGTLKRSTFRAYMTPLRRAEGSRFVESMMTVVATLKQQKRNVLDYLIAVHEAALRGEAAPSLLPARDQKSQTAA